jgi:hypothetical protein
MYDIKVLNNKGKMEGSDVSSHCKRFVMSGKSGL